ncbi:MFS transporter [Geodermatophilus marinus]|uniref:MFS transporter n=1 Tax=Geodermatophilus sp. LHW52908 TaxID=2303986 RepID=UPI000E3EDB63|nr:MFS transporter [Geodermatophilus sp. LHW52908]RFU23132.1 MFS transporter [Geodermatophilus sp. LHW52908]
MSAPAQTGTRFGRVVGASIVGTTVEWYDFFLYGSAAALVFGPLFFPESDDFVGVLAAFATYAVGFFARPVGALVFGHFGDRLGRKKLLVVSLLMMGGATFLIGLLPTYGSVGVLAPVLLIALRLVQGFALGGEWGGAVLIVSEHGRPEHRGFWASWPQAGAPAGNLLATGVLAALAAFQSDAAFEAWGWRIPFLLSAVLILVGLWVRLSVSESPVFLAAQRAAEAQAAATGRAEKAPIVTVLTRYRREVLTAMGARIAENVSFYLLTAFSLTYLTNVVGLDSSFALNAVLLASVVHLVTIPLWGHLSDRLGRRPVYLLGATGIGAWAFAFFPLLDTGRFALAVVAVTVGLLFHGAMYGPQAAFFSELFGTKARYTGVSVGAQLSSLVAGAPAPLIALALLGSFDAPNVTAVVLYVVGCAVVTLLAVWTYGETSRRDLADDAATDAAGRADGAATGAGPRTAGG